MTQISRRAVLRGFGAASALALPVVATAIESPAAAPEISMPEIDRRFLLDMADDSLTTMCERGSILVVNPALTLRPLQLVYLHHRDGSKCVAELQQWISRRPIAGPAAAEYFKVRTYNPDQSWYVATADLIAAYRIEGIYSFEGETVA